jgi:hypothetical protein
MNINDALKPGYATPPPKGSKAATVGSETPYSPYVVTVGTPDLRKVLEEQKEDETRAKEAKQARAAANNKGGRRTRRRKVRRSTLRRRRSSTKSAK